MEEKWDIKKLLNWSTEYFQGKGIESSRLDAEILLSHLLHVRRLDLYLQFERPLHKKELADYKALIKRRVNNEPVAYIVGKKEFWSRDFVVTRDVLIPRPDTEVLVEVVLDELKSYIQKEKGRGKKEEIFGFEVGVGSGNIAVTILSELKDVEISAIEKSEKAVKVASQNANLHGVQDRLQITQEDIFDYTNTKHETQNHSYDFIISNPPYCRTGEIQKLPATVRDFEPVDALDGGEDGLKYYRVLTEWSWNHLKENGFLAVEIGEDQGEVVLKMFQDAGFSGVKIKKDYGGLDRVVWGFALV